MIWKIYISPRFNKQIRALRKADKKAEAAAVRAEEIISRLTAGDNPYDLKRLLTKNGELRLDNALKYNLGAGYRMICLRRKNKLFILHVGAHDECDRFLTTHRGASVEVDNVNPLVATPAAGQRQDSGGSAPAGAARLENLEKNRCEKDPYEERLLAKLDDKILRRIFPAWLTRQPAAKNVPQPGQRD